MSDTTPTAPSAVFDFDAFIAETALPEASVAVYKRDTRAEIERLEAELEALPDDADADERLSSRGSARQIVEQIAAARQAMDASRVDLRLRALKASEFLELRKAGTSLDIADQLALQNISPVLTASQWRQVGDAIGAAQWMYLAERANALCLEAGATPDFSRRASQILSMREH